MICNITTKCVKYGDMVDFLNSYQLCVSLSKSMEDTLVMKSQSKTTYH